MARAQARSSMAAVLAAGALLPLAARADIDWNTADWGGYSVNSLSYWSYSDMARRSAERAQEAARPGGRSASRPKPKSRAEALSVAANRTSSGGFEDGRGLDALARMYPRDQFFERKKQFRQIVKGFNESVQGLYGVPPDNLATGLTVALAGSYAAYHNRSFPDQWVKPLYRQMEEMLLNDPRLEERAPVSKAGDYQVMVGTGMMLMLAQAEVQKNPDAASERKLRQAGAEALKALLNTHLDRVEFTARGLRVR